MRTFRKITNKLLKSFGRESKSLLFEHVPKCGGTSITEYLVSQYADHEIFKINGRQPLESIERFKELTPTERQRYKMIIGHGAHQLRSWVDNFKLATVLRDPVDRIISHYFYVRRNERHYMHEQVVGRNISLEDYVTSDISGELRNNYVCRFLQVNAAEVDSAPEDHLSRTLAMLQDEYHWVGLLESLNQDFQSLRRLCYYKSAYEVKRLNVTGNRIALDQVPESTIRVIQEANSLDVELYDRLRRSKMSSFEQFRP